MNRSRRMCLWLLSASLWALATWAWQPAPGVPPEGPALGPSVRPLDKTDPLELEAAARGFSTRNPFRFQRRPTEVRFGSPRGAAAPQVPLEAEEPDLSRVSLAGIVGGPPWAVILEGLPGAERGVLIQVGDQAHGVTVRDVRGDAAVLSSADTTWTVSLKPPWT